MDNINKKFIQPRPFGLWIKLYEERDGSKFEIDANEELWFMRDIGFFTWCYDFNKKRLLIPKMCGNGKYMRNIIYKMAEKLRDLYNCEGVLYCTKRKAKVYTRVTGGSVIKQEKRGDKILSWIYITFDNMNNNIRGDYNGK